VSYSPIFYLYLGVGCGLPARASKVGPSFWAPLKLSTNAKKVTVSVLYWYEKLSSLSYGWNFWNDSEKNQKLYFAYFYSITPPLAPPLRIHPCPIQCSSSRLTWLNIFSPPFHTYNCPPDLSSASSETSQRVLRANAAGIAAVFSQAIVSGDAKMSKPPS